jgi:hypothetical protein
MHFLPLHIIRCLLSRHGRETLLTGLQYRTLDRLCQNRTFWMGLIDFYLIKSFIFFKLIWNRIIQTIIQCD